MVEETEASEVENRVRCFLNNIEYLQANYFGKKLPILFGSKAINKLEILDTDSVQLHEPDAEKSFGDVAKIVNNIRPEANAIVKKIDGLEVLTIKTNNGNVIVFPSNGLRYLVNQGDKELAVYAQEVPDDKRKSASPVVNLLEFCEAFEDEFKERKMSSMLMLQPLDRIVAGIVLYLDEKNRYVGKYPCSSVDMVNSDNSVMRRKSK